MDPVVKMSDAISGMQPLQIFFITLFMLVFIIASRMAFYMNNKRNGREPASKNPFYMMATFDSREWLVFAAGVVLSVASAAAAVAVE